MAYPIEGLWSPSTFLSLAAAFGSQLRLSVCNLPSNIQQGGEARRAVCLVKFGLAGIANRGDPLVDIRQVRSVGRAILVHVVALKDFAEWISPSVALPCDGDSVHRLAYCLRHQGQLCDRLVLRQRFQARGPVARASLPVSGLGFQLPGRGPGDVARHRRAKRRLGRLGHLNLLLGDKIELWRGVIEFEILHDLRPVLAARFDCDVYAGFKYPAGKKRRPLVCFY